MLEIERKYLLSQEQIANLDRLATKLNSKHFTDSYFDDADYSLTRSSRWLRRRDSTYELKVRESDEATGTDIYREITGEAIVPYLFDSDVDLETGLAEKNIVPFATFTTTRTSYSLENTRIDLDIADFGDFTYQVAEIEVVVDHRHQIAAAEEKLDFAADKLRFGAPADRAGKLIVYLRERRPDHYAVLLESGAIRVLS